MSVSSRNTRRTQRTITNNGKLNLVQICLDNIVNNIAYWTAYLDPLTLNKSKWIITPFDALPEPQRFIPALISRLSQKSTFNEITLGVFLVHNLQYLSVAAPFINDSYVELICKRCPALRYLDVSKNKNVSNVSARAITWFCQDIEHLNISKTKITEEGVLLLIRKYPKLKTLELASLDITDTTVKAIANNCSLLETLNLAACERVEDEGIALIFHKCHALRSLNLSALWSLTDFGVLDLAQCSGLTELNLSDSSISDEVIAPILQSLPALEKLNLSNCQNMALHHVFAALASCPVLHALDISHPPRSGSYHGIQRLTGLTELRARSAIDEYSMTALKFLTGLHVLDLSQNLAVNDDALRVLAALSCLRELNLSRDENVTAAGLEAVLLANTQLESLDIAQCSLAEAPQLCNALTALKQLRVVNVQGNKTMTAKHVGALLTQLPLLELIDIRYNSLVPLADCSKWQESYKYITFLY